MGRTRPRHVEGVAAMGTRGRYRVSRFYGRNKFLCGERLMVGPDWKGTVVTAVCIIVPAVLYFTITLPYLITRWVPGGTILASISAVLLVLVAISMYLTATGDPGILPRSPEVPDEILRNPAHPRERIVYVDQTPITTKYCETCRIWRPPRASHCATCNNCVDRFDHHCPYLGTCIGRRSYRSFYLFVVTAALSCVLVITACIIHLVTKTVDFRNATSPPTSVTSALKSTLTDGGTAVQLAIIPFCFLAFLFTGGLTVFHLWLMWRNVTTAESFKRTWAATGNPFPDRGLRSIWGLLCTSKPPSKIKETYDETAALAARDAADAVTAATAASVAAAAAAVAAGDLRGEEESLAAREHRKLALNGHPIHPPGSTGSDYVSSIPSSAGHSLYAVDKDEDEDELMGRNRSSSQNPRHRGYNTRPQARVMLPLRGYGGVGPNDMV